MDFTAVEFLRAASPVWAFSASLAGAVFALLLLGELLSPSKIETGSLWLMGAQSDAAWHEAFGRFFDLVFGSSHLTIRCFLASSGFSLVCVLALWLAFTGTPQMFARVQESIALGTVLFTGLIVNVMTDYFSLLQSRMLIKFMPSSIFGQVAYLFLDLFLTAMIALSVITLYAVSPLYAGEEASVGQVVGLFSVLSIFFFSSFFSSVWIWIFAVSSWTHRLFKLFKLSDWLNIEKRPFLVLANVLGLATFVVSLAIGAVIVRNQSGVSLVDRALCGGFGGETCLEVSGLSTERQTEIAFLISACETGLAGECAERGLGIFNTSGLEEITLVDQLLGVSCDAGNDGACGLQSVLRFDFGGGG